MSRPLEEVSQRAGAILTSPPVLAEAIWQALAVSSRLDSQYSKHCPRLLLVLLVSASASLWRAPSVESGTIVHSEDLSTSELVARGEYLVTAGNCASCHTTQNGAFMSGGLPFRTPFGTIYSTNITPDQHTGIGNWNEIDFLNSLRHGVRTDGDHLYPAFPYTAYTKASDDDILAMFAYLKSINRCVQAHRKMIGFSFNFRPLVAFWKLLYFRPGVMKPMRTSRISGTGALIW